VSSAQPGFPLLAVNACSQKPFCWQAPRCLVLVAFITLCLFFVASVAASPAPQLSGSYRITATADLGTEMRFTVELNFFNPADNAVTVTGVSLRSALSPGHMVSNAASVTVQSHSKAQVTLQFLVPKRDYATWSAGPHQLFLVNVQSAGAKPGVANVLLRRTK
jgi:amino acid transporter